MRIHHMKKNRLAALLGLGLMTAVGQSAYAACSYTISNSWGTGFTAAIKITNDTATSVNGWQVNWAYSKNTVTNSWNTTLTGSYTATNLSWNSSIQPGQSVEFGLQGATNNGAVETPQVQGTLCAASASSTSSKSSSVSSSSSVKTSSSSLSSSTSSSRSSQSSSLTSSSKSSSSLTSSSRSSVSSSSSSASSVFAAITTQYEYEGINTSNAAYKDSNRFRLYYGASGKLGPKGNLGTHTDTEVNQILAHMEKVYDFYVTGRGFKSPAQSVYASKPGFFKINVYSITDIDAGGFMGYNGTAGLSYLVMRSNLLNVDHISTHEFGHGITLAEAIWIDKARTGAWWETVAQWFADTYIYPLNGSSEFDVNASHIGSYLTIVHKDNLYEAWPFLTYLTTNPDNYTNLGRDGIRSMIRAHQDQETPLHSLARLVQPTSVQTLVGRYRARMAYGDIGHTLIQQRVLNAQKDTSFRSQAYHNLDTVDSTTYRVVAARKPQYMGSNIIPLTATSSGQINIQVTNLGNGLSDSGFTAVVAIKAANNTVRYVDLVNGAGSFQLASGEESSLVVTNTPSNLYQYNAFESTSTSADVIGLNYQVQILGAKPRD